mgnify:FL=1
MIAGMATPAIHEPLRLALDTNVWLDWLVFADPGVKPIQEAVARGAARIYISAGCLTELTRVLGYPLSGRALDAQAQVTALKQCRVVARTVESFGDPHAIKALPRCEDPDDQMFLELARDCCADALKIGRAHV